MKYRHCIFDLYGTLVDIRTDERSPRLWVRMAQIYRRGGAVYQPGELRDSYFRLIRELEGADLLRRDAHEAHPEIQIEQVFRRLYADKGAEASEGLAARTALAFRRHSTEYLRLYGCCPTPRAFSPGGSWISWESRRSLTVYTSPPTTAVKSRIPGFSRSCSGSGGSTQPRP